MLRIPSRGKAVAALFAALIAFVPAMPANADPSSAASPVPAVDGAGKGVKVGTIEIPNNSAQGESAVIICDVILDDPFLGPDALVHTHVNVFCQLPIFSIYAEVLIFVNRTAYQPSFRSAIALFDDVLNLGDGGAPCNTGSGDVYEAFTYVEVQNDGFFDNAEFLNPVALRC